VSSACSADDGLCFPSVTWPGVATPGVGEWFGVALQRDL
jgi:hypothetical protein